MQGNIRIQKLVYFTCVLTKNESEGLHCCTDSELNLNSQLTQANNSLDITVGYKGGDIFKERQPLPCHCELLHCFGKRRQIQN